MNTFSFLEMMLKISKMNVYQIVRIGDIQITKDGNELEGTFVGETKDFRYFENSMGSTKNGT